MVTQSLICKRKVVMPVSKAVVDVSRDRLCEGLALGRAGIERSLSEELLWPPQSQNTFQMELTAAQGGGGEPGLPHTCRNEAPWLAEITCLVGSKVRAVNSKGRPLRAGQGRRDLSAP